MRARGFIVSRSDRGNRSRANVVSEGPRGLMEKRCSICNDNPPDDNRTPPVCTPCRERNHLIMLRNQQDAEARRTVEAAVTSELAEALGIIRGRKRRRYRSRDYA